MNTILSTWCDICTRLQAFAVMALAALLMWAWHVETYPPGDDDLSTGDPIEVFPRTGEGVVSTDTLEGRRAA